MDQETVESIDRDLGRLREVIASRGDRDADGPLLGAAMSAVRYLQARRIQAEYRERGIDTPPQA